MTTQMRDADMPLLDRIDAAIKRVTSGQGQMRMPVEATDPDVVLLDCKREIEQLRAAIAAAESAKRPREDPEPEIAFLRRVADARQQIIDGMIAERCAKQDAEMPRPLADWHEDDGAVVWWRFLVDEPAWIGTPLDDDWPGYHTHWTPHPKPPERER